MTMKLYILLITSVLFTASLQSAHAQATTFYDKPWPFANPAPESNDSVPDLLSKILNTLQSSSLSGAASQGGAPNWQATRVVATTNGTAGLPVRASRRRVACINGTGDVIYIGPATGVNSSTGYPIQPNTTISLSTTAPIYATSANGTDVIWFVETY